MRNVNYIFAGRRHLACLWIMETNSYALYSLVIWCYFHACKSPFLDVFRVCLSVCLSLSVLQFYELEAQRREIDWLIKHNNHSAHYYAPVHGMLHKCARGHIYDPPFTSVSSCLCVCAPVCISLYLSLSISLSRSLSLSLSHRRTWMTLVNSTCIKQLF